MSRAWLSVVGIGEDGIEGLAPAAHALIADAEILVGGARHLAMVRRTDARRIAWTGVAEDIDRIVGLRDKRVCVLASGDPMWFGVGAMLAKRVPASEITVAPHPGAFSLAAARMVWPLAEVACLSVHGRPLEAIALHLHHGARLLVLAEDETSAAKLAALLRARGYAKSKVTVLERLGGPNEKIRAGLAANWRNARRDALSVIAIEARADRPGVEFPRVGGLPLDAFAHDGQITQPEFRAAALVALAPTPGALLWDIGAGAGSVAIEWMRAGGRAIAVERVSARRDFIARNAVALGVPGLEIVAGTAPQILGRLRQPEAIFIGGGTSNAALLERAWKELPRGGRLVAHAVTAEGEAALLAFHATMGGELVRLSCARLAPVGRFHRWHPEAPVTQYKSVK